MTDDEKADDESAKVTREIIDDYLVAIRSLVAACEAGAITKMQLGQIMYACAVTIVTMGLPPEAKAVVGKEALQYAAALNVLTGSILT